MHHLGERDWFHPYVIYLTAVSLKFLPISETSLRLPTVVIATVNVVLMFLVALRLFKNERWALAAAVLLAITPAHYVNARVAFDFLYPVPWTLAWFLCLLIYLDTGRTLVLFATTTVLGVGFYSYIASVAFMSIYFVLTLMVLALRGERRVRTYAVAAAGFIWPLLLFIPWVATQPTFVLDMLNKYRMGEASARSPAHTSLADLFQTMAGHIRIAAIARRLSLYWSFLDPSFLFVIGGYAPATSTTRLVGVFLLPFLALIPLGMARLVTARRTIVSLVIFLGFILAPVPAVVAVGEPYAVQRMLPMLVFGVLLAVYGFELLLTWRGRAARLVMAGLVALLPLHFGFFLYHYYGDYHARAGYWFEFNHRDALETIIALSPPNQPRPVYLTSGDEKLIEVWWLLFLAKHGREDLLPHTVYFNAKATDGRTFPPGSLVFATRSDEALLRQAATGEFREIMRAFEPGDDPVFIVLERTTVNASP